tara:strand:- start:1474 stop:1773 length:300 start_codon:yes stop_codon:yes gene_type:complete
MQKFNITEAAFANSIKKISSKGHLKGLLKGYYLAIPLEFRHIGFVPPEVFIDDLMRALDLQYYVALLSASAFYGSTHHASQIFQVMVKKAMKPLLMGKE